MLLMPLLMIKSRVHDGRAGVMEQIVASRVPVRQMGFGRLPPHKIAFIHHHHDDDDDPFDSSALAAMSSSSHPTDDSTRSFPRQELVVRAHERPNLFARLDRTVAAALARELTAASPLRSCDSLDAVEFLVLELESNDGSLVYVSYNGGDRGDDNDEEDHGSSYNATRSIELPQSLIASCHLPSVVSVHALAQVPIASSLTLQAVSAQDYTQLSQFADWLEQGGLLQQVSVVYPNQVLTLQVEGGALIQVKVLNEEQDEDRVEGDGHHDLPNVTRQGEDKQRGSMSIWEDDNDSGTDQAAGDQEPASPPDESKYINTWPKCWRLVAETELIVLPPPPLALPAPPMTCRLYPSRLDYPCVADDLLPVAQGCALMHSQQVQELLGETAPPSESLYIRITTITVAATTRDISTVSTALATDQESSAVATRILLVEISDQVPPGWIVLHALARVELGLDLAKDFVQVNLVPLIEVQSLCATARFVGLQLEMVPIHRQQTLTAWRYPTGWPASSVSNINQVEDDTLAVDPSLIDGISHYGTPIRISSLLNLPLHARTRGISQSVLYRLILASGNQVGIPPLSSSDLYVFAHDIRRLLTNASQTNTDASGELATNFWMNKAETITSRESFSLSWSLQGRKLYCASLFDTLQPFVRAVHICGGTGSGKTQAALAVAAKIGLEKSTLYLDCRRLKESKAMRLSTILQELETVFIDAARCDASIVILDNLDDLLPSYGDDIPGSGSAHTIQQNPGLRDECFAIEGTLCRLLKDVSTSITSIITSTESAKLPLSIQALLSIDCIINLPVLADNDRLKLFLDFFLEDDVCQDDFFRELTDFARKTAGFRPGDLERLASRVKQHLAPCEGCLASATLETLGKYTPLNRMSTLSEDGLPGYNWSDVGGLFDVKKELSSIIRRPSMYKRIYDTAQIRLPRGLLLFGPSGCGKSYIVPALAKKCGFPLIVCRGPELLSKYIGASEGKVREIFTRAASVAPSILFLDELDALAPRRGSDSTGVTDRVVNQLLTFLDGVEETTAASGTVYIIAASSRPDKIDPALLRPGRLERHVYVGTPRTMEEWSDLIMQTTQRYDIADSVLEQISSGRLMHDLRDDAPHAFQFTAADVNAVFHTAQVTAAHEVVALGRDMDRAILRMDHIMDAFRSTRPCLSMDGWQRLVSVYDSFRGGGKHSRQDHLPQEPLRVALR